MKKNPKAKKKVKKSFQTASDNEVAWAKHIIINTIEPKLKTMVDILNSELSKRGVRAGLEIIWRFDKELEDESESI